MRSRVSKLSARSIIIVIVAIAAVALGTSSCSGRKKKGPMGRVAVSVHANDVAAAAAALTVLEAAVRLPGIANVRTTSNGRDGVVIIEGSDVAALTVALGSAVAAARPRLPKDVDVDVARVDDDVAVFAVRGKDVFAARDWVEGSLRPALAVMPGVTGVVVSGGLREKQVQVDLARMLAKDVTLVDVLRAAGGGASLETTIVKSVLPASAPPPPPPSMMKMAERPPQEGEVRVLLPEVADIGLLPVGEAGRRDGGIEVRVLGSIAHTVVADPKAVIAAGLAVPLPAGIEMTLLDDSSVEGVDIIVVVAGGSGEALQRELLDVPGVRLLPPRQTLSVEVDAVRAALLGVDAAEVNKVVDAALRGHTLVRNTENVVLRLKSEPSPELLLQLVVGTTKGAPVRLSDVATVNAEPTCSDRIDGKPALRLRVVFDVGVRKNALTSVISAVSFSRLPASIEPTDPAAALCR